MSDIDDMAAELVRLRKEREWRDISTAPSDGSTIIAYREDHPEKVFVTLADGEFWRVEQVGPTHWMPLPSPPARTQGE